MSDITKQKQPNSNEANKKIKQSLLITWLLLLVIAGIFVVWVLYFFSTVNGNKEGTIHLYSLNDYHGSVYQTDEEAGLSELTYYLNELDRTNQEKGDESLFLLSGDNYSGTLESNFNEGELLSKAFKEMNISYSALGNHEFDYFDTNYNDELYKLEGIAGMQFLSANVVDKESQELLPFLDPYAIEPIRVDGVGTVNIGILGLSTVETIEAGNPNVTLNLDIKDPTETANEYIPIMQEEGADVIIALTHIPSVQIDSNEIIGEEINNLATVDGLDAIFSAHSHEFVNGKINDKVVVQGGHAGMGISEIEINVKKDGDDVTIKNIEGSYNVFQDEIADNKMKNTNSFVNEQIEKYGNEIEEVKNEELATTEFKLVHERHGSSPKPTQLGSLVSDLIIRDSIEMLRLSDDKDLEELKNKFRSESSLTIVNDGGIRSNVEAGTITYGDIYNVFPFGNTVDVLEVTGSQVYELFEYGLSSGIAETDVDGNGIGPIQYDYGVKILGDGTSYDSDAELGEGNAVNKIEVLDSATRYANPKVDDEISSSSYIEIERDNTSYLIVTNSFIADGGDGFNNIISPDDVIFSTSITTLDLIANELRLAEGLEKVSDYYSDITKYQARYIIEV